MMSTSVIPFLDRLDPADRAALLDAGSLRRWSAGDVLFREGDRAGAALIISSGLVKIHKRGQDANDLILALSGPGDLLGEVAVQAEATRSADVTALEAVEAVSVGVIELRRLLTALPQLSLALLDLTLGRLRLADARRLEATAESLPRVTSRLMELAERFGVASADGQITVSMPINQEELASWAGTSRESTARALRTLRELSLIETHRRRLVVHDLAGLGFHATRR